MAKKKESIDAESITSALFNREATVKEPVAKNPEPAAQPAKDPAPEAVAPAAEPKPEPVKKKPAARRKKKVADPVPPPVDDSLKMFTTKMRNSLHKELKMISVSADKSIQDILDEALTEYIKKRNK